MKSNKKDEPLWCKIYRKEVLKPKQREKITEQKGRTEASRAGFYNTSAWKKLRDQRRNANPVCKKCEERGYVNAMKVVDHIIPIEEAPELALDFDNTQSLCDYCHQRKTNHDKKRKAHEERLRIGKKIMADLEKKFRG